MQILTKLGQLVVTVVLVTLFSSFLLELVPGDPIDILVPFNDPELQQQVREDVGLDEPFLVRYVDWLSGFVRFWDPDLGNYYQVSSVRPVSDRVVDALPVSLQLMVSAQLMGLVVAIPLGVLTAHRKDTWFDRLSGLSAFAMLSIPNFVLAFVLQYYLGVKLGWFPITGNRAPGWWVMPSITLAVGQIAVYMRLLRSDMIATLQQDFILMAKAKGLSTRRILFRHALRPSSLTLLTVAGLNVGTLIGGTLIVEVVFQAPGMGFLLFEAIRSLQFVAFQSIVAIIAVLYVLVNFAVDLLYTALDPRIRNAR